MVLLVVVYSRGFDPPSADEIEAKVMHLIFYIGGGNVDADDDVGHSGADKVEIN